MVGSTRRGKISGEMLKAERLEVELSQPTLWTPKVRYYRRLIYHHSIMYAYQIVDYPASCESDLSCSHDITLVVTSGIFINGIPPPAYLAWGCKNCTSSVELDENVEQTMPVT